MVERAARVAPAVTFFSCGMRSTASSSTARFHSTRLMLGLIRRADRHQSPIVLQGRSSNRLDSTLLIVEGQTSSGETCDCATRYYKWTGRQFKLILHSTRSHAARLFEIEMTGVRFRPDKCAGSRISCFEFLPGDVDVAARWFAGFTVSSKPGFTSEARRNAKHDEIRHLVTVEASARA